MLALGLSVLLLGAPADTSATPAEPSARQQPIARVWLVSPGLDAQALTGAVSARLADKEILAAGATAGPRAGLAAMCHVSLQGEALRLELIVSDGRLYQRTIAAPNEERERAAARLIASTVAAIEDASALPDRRDAVFVPPVAEVEAAVVPAPGVSEPGGARPADPELARPGASEVARAGGSEAGRAGDPVSGGARGSPDENLRDAEPVRAGAGSERAVLELGVAIAGGPGFGLGTPAAGRGLAGGGGELRVDLRLRGGIAVGAGFRGRARVQDELALGRFRGALTVGYVLRHGAFELAALVGPTLETWQVRQRGEPVAYTTTSSSGASLLFGGIARLAPGGRIVRPRMSLRIGGYVEFAGSARSSGRAAQIARQGAPGAVTPVFVIGGAELSLGVEVEVWVRLLRRRTRETMVDMSAGTGRGPGGALRRGGR